MHFTNDYIYRPFNPSSRYLQSSEWEKVYSTTSLLRSPEMYFVHEWIRWSFFILHAAMASGVRCKEIGGEKKFNIYRMPRLISWNGGILSEGRGKSSMHSGRITVIFQSASLPPSLLLTSSSLPCIKSSLFYFFYFKNTRKKSLGPLLST